MSGDHPARVNRVILVHGHDLKPGEAALREISFSAIRHGVRRDYPDDAARLDSTLMDMAYYGDLVNERLLAAGDRQYDEELDLGDRRNALEALQAITSRKKFGFRQYDVLPGKSAMKEFVADVVAPTLGILGLTMPLLRASVPDLAAYLTNDDGFGDKVRARVYEQLAQALEGGDRIMLVAHGMGAVAAFDVLWQLSRNAEYERFADQKIDTLVTLGAPLCDNFLRGYLLGAKEKGLGRYPGNIITWLNVSAEDDYVCHDGTVADDFASMMRHRIVSQIRDFRIYNQTVRWGKSNPHSSVGYFVHPRMSKIIRDWVCRDSSAP